MAVFSIEVIATLVTTLVIGVPSLCIATLTWWNSRVRYRKSGDYRNVETGSIYPMRPHLPHASPPIDAYAPSTPYSHPHTSYDAAYRTDAQPWRGTSYTFPNVP